MSSVEIYESARDHIYGHGEYAKDVRKGAELLKQAAEMSHPRAMFEWGMALWNGMYFVKKEEELGRALVTEAAELGDQLALAYCFRQPLGVYTEDKKRAFEILQSLDASDPWVMYFLGDAFNHGHGVQVNYDTALQWFQRATDAGHPLAQYWLSVYYWYGHGVAEDRKRAFELLPPLAAEGYAGALWRLGWSYEYGVGVEKDLDKAGECYNLAHAQGHDCTKNLADLAAKVKKEKSECIIC